MTNFDNETFSVWKFDRIVAISDIEGLICLGSKFTPEE